MNRIPNHPLAIAAWLVLAASTGLCADFSSYTAMLQNNAARQASLNAQMFPLGAIPKAAPGDAAAPAPCMPPFELQRGMDGHVPPELQGDPRYQAYLRCQQGRSAGSTERSAPSPAARAHLPMSATDFVPVQAGHPVVDRAIADLDMAPGQRLQLRNGVEEMFRQVAAGYRGNNVAVAVAVAYATAWLALSGARMTEPQTLELIRDVNDRLAGNPGFAAMSDVDRQNQADRLIYQSVVIAVLRDMGLRDPQARQQSMVLARVVLKQLNGA